MVRALMKTRSLPVVIGVAALVALSGCGGGGGGGGGNASGVLLGVSFLGFPPGSALTTIPGVFRDQCLEFTFDGPLDDGVLGGFFSQGGVPVEFQGVPPAGSQGVPYYAFVDQAGARSALQIRENNTAILLASYVVGRHRDHPNIIIVDPRVNGGNPLGLPANQGFKADTTYLYMIPAGGPFTFQGATAPGYGPTTTFVLPLPIPPFTNQPALSILFQSSASFGPDPVPPSVLSITSLSGAAGTIADPIPEADSLVISFSKTISSLSIDQSKNFVVRNIDVVNSTFPGGIQVPGSLTTLTPGATDYMVYIYTPASAYGPGPPVTPAEGFDIEVRIGSFGQPASSVPPLLGLPTGLSGTQLALSNSLNRFFRTTNCTGCQTPASVVENFDNTLFRDATFQQTFSTQQARWNSSTASGQLAGRLTTGSPAGNNAAALGTRVQFIVDPQPPTTNPAGLFSPFDASLASSGNQCPGIPTGCNLGAINPNGGSHIMHIYESAELGTTEDSLEQIEWSSVSGVTAATTYPNYKIWCGVSSTPAPLAGGTAQGLSAVFDNNYNLTPYQTGIPVQAGCANPTATNPRKVPCGGPSPYVVMLQTTTFYPFPVLSPCFDFSTSTGASGSGVNLLFEQDIDPGTQAPNFNRYRANAFNPVRRLVDKPLILVTGGLCPFNNGGTFDVYRHRFTFVGIVGQARSLWYDTGTPNPNYISFILTPGVGSQPAGTFSTWILEGTDTANPGPTTNGSAGIYINASGAPNTTVLTTTIAQLRYFRFRVEFRGNNVSNATPAYSSVTMAYTF
jgi:hypothetical protein